MSGLNGFLSGHILTLTTVTEETPCCLWVELKEILYTDGISTGHQARWILWTMRILLGCLILAHCCTPVDGKYTRINSQFSILTQHHMFSIFLQSWHRTIATFFQNWWISHSNSNNYGCRCNCIWIVFSHQPMPPSQDLHPSIKSMHVENEHYSQGENIVIGVASAEHAWVVYICNKYDM